MVHGGAPDSPPSQVSQAFAQTEDCERFQEANIQVDTAKGAINRDSENLSDGGASL